VTRVVPDAQVDAEAYATARRIAEGAPLVHRWHKKFLRALTEGRELTPAERDEAFACYDTQDFAEGRRAFLAKAKPAFEGR
jgi:enoyl-CoA hydratase/carnithine racemase